MNRKVNTALLPCLVFGAGCIGAALRALMYAVATDENGLLTPLNVPSVLVILLSVALGVTVVLLSRASSPEEMRTRLTTGGISAILAAVGVAVMLLSDELPMGDGIGKLRMLLGALSVPCFLGIGVCRIRKKSVPFLLYFVVCLYFSAHLIHFYRVWSALAQLSCYLWQMLAGVCLLMCAYSRTACAVGLGTSRRAFVWSMLAAYACMLCIADESYAFTYCTWALWALTDTAIRTEPPEEVAEEA